MDEFTLKRYQQSADAYIDVLLSRGLLEASLVLASMSKTLDRDMLMGFVTDKLRSMGYRIKGEKAE